MAEEGESLVQKFKRLIKGTPAPTPPPKVSPGAPTTRSSAPMRNISPEELTNRGEEAPPGQRSTEEILKEAENLRASNEQRRTIQKATQDLEKKVAEQLKTSPTWRLKQVVQPSTPPPVTATSATENLSKKPPEILKMKESTTSLRPVYIWEPQEGTQYGSFMRLDRKVGFTRTGEADLQPLSLPSLSRRESGEKPIALMVEGPKGRSYYSPYEPAGELSRKLFESNFRRQFGTDPGEAIFVTHLNPFKNNLREYEVISADSLLEQATSSSFLRKVA